MINKLLTTSGVSVPFVGLGTFPFQGREMADIVIEAVKIGYRLFDTADDYRGEPGLGLAINELGEKGECSRDDIFIQTKISDNNAHSDEPLKGIYFNKSHPFMQKHTAKDIVREKVDISLRSMRTPYLDSLLIHYPYPDYYVEIWKEMINLRNEGIIRYIGVSNFHVRHLKTLYEETGVFPDINEIYISPISIKKEIVDYCQEHDCIPMTYSPLMDIRGGRITIETIEPIMKKYQKSLSQVILRWNIERGCLPIPKSKNPARLRENFDVHDFSLTQEEIAVISNLNYDYQYLVESKICPGL